MATAVLVPLAEYLAHTYHPDCDFVEGHLVERNVGEIGHSDAQGRAYLYVLTQTNGFWAGVEVRVQVKADRYRVPDVTIVRGGIPEGRIIAVPPEVVVEVLSPDDRAADLQDKVDDYLAFGVQCVWVINPDSRRAWIYTGEGSREVKDGLLHNPAGDLALPLTFIFPR